VVTEDATRRQLDLLRGKRASQGDLDDLTGHTVLTMGQNVAGL